MSWANAIAELRALLSDGDTDKPVFGKQCLGFVNGVNATFKTFDERRVTAMAGASAPFGAFVDGTLAAVSSEDTTLGTFVLGTPPQPGSRVEATYYYRWFLDPELQIFLNKAAEWLGFTEVPDNVPVGLKPSALNYAAGLAYEKLAVRWALDNSDVYKMQDSDSKNRMPANPWAKMASDYKKDAVALRDTFYERQGQPNAPLVGYVYGRVRNPVPKS